MPVEVADSWMRVMALISMVLCDVPVGYSAAEVWLFRYRGIAQSVEMWRRAKCAAPV